MIRIGIVGSQEDKWTEEQKVKAIREIGNIFVNHQRGFITLGQDDCMYDFSNIILVSGHCPKGGVDIWAEEIADELGIKKEILFIK